MIITFNEWEKEIGIYIESISRCNINKLKALLKLSNILIKRKWVYMPMVKK